MKHLLIATSLLFTLPCLAVQALKYYVDMPDGLYRVHNVLAIPGFPATISENNFCMSPKTRAITQNAPGKSACEVRTIKDTTTEAIAETDCLVHGKMHYTRVITKMITPTTYESYVLDAKTNKTTFSAFYKYISPCKK